MSESQLFERQLNTLLNRVKSYVSTGYSDRGSFQAICRLVSDDQVQSDHAPLCNRALAQLDPSGAQCLKEIQEICRERFYVEDRVLCAIAVPVAVHWCGRPTNAKVAVVGRGQTLQELSTRIKALGQGRRVILGRGLYDASSLLHTRPREMLHHLLKLEAESAHAQESFVVPVPAAILPSRDPHWIMRYFLGVEITGVDDQRLVCTKGFQESIAHWAGLGERAVMDLPAGAARRNFDISANCLGVWYLRRAVRKGEMSLRDHRLHIVLANMCAVGEILRVHFTVDPLGDCARVLVSSKGMTVEHRWPLFEGETVDVIDDALKNWAMKFVPHELTTSIRRLDWTDYNDMARRSGLSWMWGTVK